jgi:hypothetical protein
MRRSLLTFLTSVVWLLASPSLQWQDSRWLEVGAPPAAAQSIMVDEPQRQPKKKPVKKTTKKRVGSSGGVVTSNQPGFHPMQPVTRPVPPAVTGTVTLPARHPEYPNVPTVPAIRPETSQDRIARCTHQGALGGLPPGEQGTYIHKCAF